MRPTATLLALLLSAACGDDSAPDAALPDAPDQDTQADATRSDAGEDALLVDAGPRDVSLPDARVATDAMLPTQLADLPLHEWRAVSQNTIEDLDPCPTERCAWSATEGLSGVVEDWTGGAYASGAGPLGGLVYWGGGHGGYYGNEVYVFDLATLMWERRSDPTDGQTPGDPGTFGLDDECRYWDGTPIAIHSYDSVFYEPGENRFWLSKIADSPASPPGPPGDCGSSFAAAFDLDTGTWSDSQVTTPVGTTFAASAWDATRGRAWVADTSSIRLHSFDPAADMWESHGSGDPLGLDMVAAIDASRDLFVIADFRSAEKLYVVDLNAGGDWFEVTTAGDTEIQSRGQTGFEWAPELDAFVPGPIALPTLTTGRRPAHRNVDLDPRRRGWRHPRRAGQRALLQVPVRARHGHRVRRQRRRRPRLRRPPRPPLRRHGSFLSHWAIY